MKRSIILGSIIITSLFLFSCGNSSSCTNTERYIPDHLASLDSMEVVADASDTSK